MSIKKVASDLHLIGLNFMGFESFLGAWLYKGKRNILIDPGPASTIKHLIDHLKEIEVKNLDLILLTHIHIDHAGGIGELYSNFPKAKIVCHKSGLKHLKAPEKLWQGSLKSLGKLAVAYGEIKPVPGSALIDSALFKDPKIKVIETPGHAVHHLSFIINDYLFIGEAAGVFSRFSKNRFYLRPATPPKFFLEKNIQSIDKLLKTSHKMICYGHFGWSEKTPELIKAHKKQLFLWKKIIYENKDTSSVEKCVDLIIERDPLLEVWKSLDPIYQKIELNFLANSVKGFLGYLESC